MLFRSEAKEPNLYIVSGGNLGGALNKHEETMDKIRGKDELREIAVENIQEKPQSLFKDDDNDKEDGSQPERDEGSQAEETPQPTEEASEPKSTADEGPKTSEQSKDPADNTADDAAEDSNNDDNADDHPSADQGGTHVSTEVP